MTSLFLNYEDERNKDLDRWENVGERVLREILESPEHPRYKEVAKDLDV